MPKHTRAVLFPVHVPRGPAHFGCVWLVLNAYLVGFPRQVDRPLGEG